MYLRIGGTAALLYRFVFRACRAHLRRRAQGAVARLVDATCFVEHGSRPPTTRRPRRSTTRCPGLPAFGVHAAHRPRRDLAQCAGPHADNQDGAGPPDPGAHRRGSDRPGALPAAPAQRLERAPRRRRRFGHAQRVQRRLRLERLRRAERLRVRVAEQGRAQSRIAAASATPRRSPRLPAEPRHRRSACTSTTTRRASLSRAGPSSWSRRARSRVTASRPPTVRRRATPTPSAPRTAATRSPRHREAPQVFDGGVDWEGTFVDPHAPNVLTDLPPAVLNFPDYRASGFNPATTAAKNIVGRGLSAGYRHRRDLALEQQLGSFWEVTLCQWQKRLDPAYDTYGKRHGHVQLHRPAVVLGRRRRGCRVPDHRRHPAAAHHRRRHHGCAAPDRPSRARVCPQGEAARQQAERTRRP